MTLSAISPPPADASVRSETSVNAAIQVTGLTKRFGLVNALNGISLTVNEGEVVALLGPNGAGKSTITRILATLVLPDSGTARISGYDVLNQPKDVRRVLGITLSDERSWYWRLSGRQNLEFFAALYGFNRRDAPEKVTSLIEHVGLIQAADRRFDGYSAGMRARLSLARALLPDPPVLLLDEPTRSLDPVATAGFREIIEDLAHAHGKAVLLTTHNLHEAAALANRVYVLVRGSIAGTADGSSSADTLERLLLNSMRT